MSKVNPDASTPLAGLNLDNRDPRAVHDREHFKVAFADIFAEPDPGVHSFGAIWRASHKTFSFTRLWTYRICSIFGVFSACLFGLQYGCTACYTIWCCTPAINAIRIKCIPAKMCLTIVLDACLRPYIHVYSLLCWNIRVTTVNQSSNV